MREEYDALTAGAANHVPLSPLSFLKRAAEVYRSRPAVTYGTVTRDWAGFAARCRSAAGGLGQLGIGYGDTVSVLAPNIPELFELHFAVPLSGAVLNTINTRLEPETVAYILRHSDSRLILCDSALVPLLRTAFTLNGADLPVIEIADAVAGHAPTGIGSPYEELAQATPCEWSLPEHEGQAIALNYTSGTSGRPKGVVYHHRGAWLMAMGTVTGWSLPQCPIYLSVVPMFHCNGWNHPWAMAAVGGHMIFTRDATPEKLIDAMQRHGVTHMGAAPIVLQMLCESTCAPARAFDPKIRVMTAGAPPPPSVLATRRRPLASTGPVPLCRTGAAPLIMTSLGAPVVVSKMSTSSVDVTCRIPVAVNSAPNAINVRSSRSSSVGCEESFAKRFLLADSFERFQRFRNVSGYHGNLGLRRKETPFCTRQHAL